MDLLFVPPVEAMYPPGSQVRVTPGAAAERWEGAARPGHFEGVLTIVAKLLHLVEPHLACFGQKDVQQLTLVRQMVRDLDWPVEIVAVPTVRELDGLALSSRNAYLRPDGRRRAAVISRALRAAYQAWCAGKTRASDLEMRMRRELEREPDVVLEYISVAEPEGLTPISEVDERTVVALAVRVGGTRLIDNINLGEGVRS